MKIALIGASGFVGTRLLGLLEESKDQYELKNIDSIIVTSYFWKKVKINMN